MSGNITPTTIRQPLATARAGLGNDRVTESQLLTEAKASTSKLADNTGGRTTIANG